MKGGVNNIYCEWREEAITHIGVAGGVLLLKIKRCTILFLGQNLGGRYNFFILGDNIFWETKKMGSILLWGVSKTFG